MATERHGRAIWPGVQGEVRCTYTTSHGLTPGRALLTIRRQDASIAEFGSLVLDDGQGRVVVPDCKLLRIIQNPDNTTCGLEIEDRRWRWAATGGPLDGEYNLLDRHGKLIAWSIRSPAELCKLCLDAMGETNYTIDMPPGLSSEQGKQIGATLPPWMGVNPVTGTNPTIKWIAETPAQALAALCELFGRRVIYRLSTDSVLITVPGAGAELPPGAVSSRSPTLKSPVTPSGVTVVGDPTRYQVRLRLEAVGEEWDGSYRPINFLSYAPLVGGEVQVSKATLFDYADAKMYACWIGNSNDPRGGQAFTYTSVGGDNAAAVVGQLRDKINAHASPLVRGIVDASVDGDALVVTGVEPGKRFTFFAEVPVRPGVTSFVPELVQVAQPKTGSWTHLMPGHWGAADEVAGSVRKTERLTAREALDLARKSVYKRFQLSDLDATGQSFIIQVPGYGGLERRQQLVLTDTQVEQVVPQSGDEQVRTRDTEDSITVNLYNGYSRDKPAAVYGSVNRLLQQLLVGEDQSENTAATDQVRLPFQLDAEHQVIVFGEPVYRYDGELTIAADLVLQTGVFVRNASTNHLEAFTMSRPVPGAENRAATFYAARRFQDVQANVIGQYAGDPQGPDPDDGGRADANRLTGAKILEADPIMRAGYYLDGMIAQYLISSGLTQEYLGFIAADLDGAIMQVTWEVGERGTRTTISRNTEHATYVPAYPARRRAEWLGPAAERVQNLWVPVRPPANPWVPERPGAAGLGA